MPVNIKIIHAHEFIRVTPEGRLNLEVSTKLLIEIAAAEAATADYDILLDTRQTQSDLSVDDLWCLAAELGKNFRNPPGRHLRTAVLCPVERFSHAEFLAICAKNRGFLIGAFTSFSEAYEWLTAKARVHDVLALAHGVRG